MRLAAPRRRGRSFTAIAAVFSVISPLVLAIPITERLDTQMRAERHALLADRLNKKLVRPVTAVAAMNTAEPDVDGPLQLLSAALDQGRSLDCLAEAVYFEARGEPLAGQLAVAEVIVNRVGDPAYSGTVCGVVYQGAGLDTGCQFSFTCDGSAENAPSGQYWSRARRISEHYVAELARQRLVPDATHYHASYMVPYWSYDLHPIRQIGSHVFYRAPSDNDVPAPPALVAVTAPSIKAARRRSDRLLANTGQRVETPAVLVALERHRR